MPSSLTAGLPYTVAKADREFGLGQTIGFTDDGMVFFIADTRTAKGAPMQTKFFWPPNQALGMAEAIKEAAEKAKRALK